MKKIKDMLKKFSNISYVKYIVALVLGVAYMKYIVVLVLGVVLIGFVGSNSVLAHLGNKQRINELKDEIDYYEGEYSRDQARIHQLQTDPKAMEQIARERYFMKHADEEVAECCLRRWCCADGRWRCQQYHPLVRLPLCFLCRGGFLCYCPDDAAV